MWLDDIQYPEQTLPGIHHLMGKHVEVLDGHVIGCMAEEEQEEVHELRPTVSSLNDELAMNELVLEHNLLRLGVTHETPAQAAQELLEVFAGVLVFVKLHHRFVDWKEKVVRRVPKGAWM